MRQLEFYKTENNRWFVNLPEWEGDHDELEMVCGADTLLDIIDMNKHNDGMVKVIVTTDKPTSRTNYHLRGSDRVIDSGRYYFVHHPYLSGFEIWLCDVTKFVFNGTFPDNIYFNI